MRRIICACAASLAISVGASAQDTEVKSRTEIQADDATVFSMTGCLRRDAAGNFTLYGTAVRSREGLTSETRVEIENDRDESKVTTSTRTKAEDGRVGTAGAAATFLLRPRANIALAEHVGRQVQLSAIMVDPDEDDADVKIEEKTTVDPARGDDKTKRSRTEIEIDNDSGRPYTVVSVKPLGSSCQ
jgi:hypothetical protein